MIFADFIDKLITERHYILAIRFIFSFNLNNNYSPLELLKKEIVNLRRSAKEKTQVKAFSDPSLGKNCILYFIVIDWLYLESMLASRPKAEMLLK